MTLLWLAVVASGLAVAARASSRGVDHAAKAAAGFGIPPILIGATLVAVGTDVPEIANSVVASVTGHGDINVGDSVGSALAQGTLVLAAIPFAAGGALAIARRDVALLGGSAVAVLLLGAGLVADGRLGRGDAIGLLLAWVVAVVLAWRFLERPAQPELPLPQRRAWAHAAIAVAAFAVVAVGAAAAVAGLVELAAVLSVPEFVISFFGQALGTSLPELAVVMSAARRGRGDLALGDALGATLADASLSLGSGPLIAPTTITAGLAVQGTLVTAAAVGAACLLLVAVGRLNRAAGVALALLYAATVPVLLAAL